VTEPDSSFDSAVAAHDRALAGAGIDLWVGSEPTFTLRSSESPEWLSEALGGDKELIALRMMHDLRAHHPGAMVLRTLGRQYAREERPRWSVGLYARRDGLPVWTGPADPLLAPVAAQEAALEAFTQALEQCLIDLGWQAVRFDVEGRLPRRIRFRLDAVIAQSDPLTAGELLRRSIHDEPVPKSGLQDRLAAQGDYVVAIGEAGEGPCRGCPCIELPAFAGVGNFQRFLEAVAQAANQAELSRLVFQGFPPPVDASVAWTTITPDPAVIEVNQAPYRDVSAFLEASRRLFSVAAANGLSPYRLQYNGVVSDSGGGGQFTLGGASPESSPFFTAPALLPRLVRYLNNHPSLSYLFAPDYLGSSSQSPRSDEGVCESFSELEIALEQLARKPQPTPEFLWRSLAPFLTDPSGNPHRSELNIEKLWNPHLPGRGCLGLVEFRAFRMSVSPERAAAIAALLRALAGMLTREDRTPRLRRWGRKLHDRFALPFYLLRDLQAVFDDLTATGFGLGPAIEAVLREDPARPCWAAEYEGVRLELQKALEFWPLVGDVASQEGGGSRLVDASTVRFQVALRGSREALAGWRLRFDRFEIPLREEQDGDQPVLLSGLRFREFEPWRGLHPGIPRLGLLSLILEHPARTNALQLELHGWQPQGHPYPGLPGDLEEAGRRRAERLITRELAAVELPPLEMPPASTVSEFSLDLRRL